MVPSQSAYEALTEFPRDRRVSSRGAGGAEMDTDRFAWLREPRSGLKGAGQRPMLTIAGVLLAALAPSLAVFLEPRGYRAPLQPALPSPGPAAQLPFPNS